MYFFLQIHTKKRNRLGTKKLNDLVYVRFNARLGDKKINKERDPLAVRDFTESKANTWVLRRHGKHSSQENEEDKAFWDVVSQARGVGELVRRLRLGRNDLHEGSSSQNKGKEVAKERGIDDEFDSSGSNDGEEDEDEFEIDLHDREELE